MPPRDPLRMLDANGNRAAEGLRALEDVARFLLDDARAAEFAKELRHDVRRLIPAAAAAARDAVEDVGAATANPDAKRSRLVDLVRANASRAQEALRAAEESARLCAPVSAPGLEAARYRAYQLESALLSRLPAWQLHRVRLYALVDTALCADPVAVAGAAARGGAGAVQLRAKGMAERAYRELAVRVQEAVARGGSLFVVNDHVAVAKVLGADAVHVGQDDLAVADARAVVGPGCAIGVSAHTPEQALAAAAAGADYVGLGPMFATATKPHEPCRGPGLLDELRGKLALPSYAIGGLDLTRIRELRPRILHGVAVAGAICKAADPEKATEELHRLLEPEDH
jgi:thiamine-phosphate pyrophosphorylase